MVIEDESQSLTNINSTIKKISCTENIENVVHLFEKLYMTIKLYKGKKPIILSNEDLCALSSFYSKSSKNLGLINAVTQTFILLLHKSRELNDNEKEMLCLGFFQNSETFKQILSLLVDIELGYRILSLFFNLTVFYPEKIIQLFLTRNDYSFLNIFLFDQFNNEYKEKLMELIKIISKNNKIKNKIKQNKQFLNYIFENIFPFDEISINYFINSFKVFSNCYVVEMKKFNYNPNLMFGLFLSSTEHLTKKILSLKKPILDLFKLYLISLQEFRYLLSNDSEKNYKLFNKKSVKIVLKSFFSMLNYLKESILTRNDLINSSSYHFDFNSFETEIISVSSQLLNLSAIARNEVISVQIRTNRGVQSSVIFLLLRSFSMDRSCCFYKKAIFEIFKEKVNQTAASSTFKKQFEYNENEKIVGYSGANVKRSSFGDIILNEICVVYNSICSGEKTINLKRFCVSIEMLTYIIISNKKVSQRISLIKLNENLLIRALSKILFSCSNEETKVQILLFFSFLFPLNPNVSIVIFRSPEMHFLKLIELIEKGIQNHSNKKNINNEILFGVFLLIILIKNTENFILPPSVLKPKINLNCLEGGNVLHFTIRNVFGAENFYNLCYYLIESIDSIQFLENSSEDFKKLVIKSVLIEKDFIKSDLNSLICEEKSIYSKFEKKTDKIFSADELDNKRLLMAFNRQKSLIKKLEVQLETLNKNNILLQYKLKNKLGEMNKKMKQKFETKLEAERKVRNMIEIENQELLLLTSNMMNEIDGLKKILKNNNIEIKLNKKIEKK